MPKKNMLVTDASAPPLSIRGFRDANNERWVEVKYQGESALIRFSEFATNRGGISSTLSDRGLVIVKRADRNSLFEQVEKLEQFADRLIFSRPGWRQGQFANASGMVFAPTGQKRGAVAFSRDLTKCSKTRSHRRWVEHVACPLAGHPIPCFFVMACFAAPLLELVGRAENIGFELAGQGGKGKSTTQRLMASVVGPCMEKDRGYISTFYTTPAALERSMQWHSDMAFIIDEANLFGGGESSTADKRLMRNFAFQMSSGTTKARYDSPQQEGYRFIYVTSANEPFNEVLGTSHRDVANAASDRLLSIVVPEGDAGVFGDLPDGYDSYRQFTLALETAMAENYGTAMPKFLLRLVRARHANEDRVKARIRQHIEHFKCQVGINDNNGSDVRVAEAFGLVYAAGRLAQAFRVLPPQIDCITAATHCYENYRSTVPLRQSLPDRLRAIAARPETLTIDKRDLPTLIDEQVEHAGAFIREMKGETLLLMTPSFGQRMFPDWNALKGTADFAALNKADEGRRGRGYHCRIRSNGKAEWFYCFKLPDAEAQPR
jgi:hypothetical protein